MAPLRLPIFAFTLAIACGCGGRTTPPDAVGDGDAGGPGPDAGAPSFYGALSASTQLLTGSRSTQSFGGGFCLQDAPMQNGSCPRQVGSCCIRTAPGSAIVPPPCTPASAGTLSITAAGTAVATLSEQDGDYATQPSVSWPPGAALTVVASGADVPAFQVDVMTPGPFAGLTPPLDSVGTYFANRTQDLTVRWTPEGRSGESVLLLLTDGTPNTVSCNVDDAAGAIVVPAQGLGLYGPNAQVGVYMLRTIDEKTRQGTTEFTLSSDTSFQSVLYFQ